MAQASDNARKKILVFDSGLGGLSILKAIQLQQPSCQFIYCSDNDAFPYGTKPESELIERVSQLLTQLEQRVKPDVIVIACNTASTVALPKVRSKISTPVVGVVPAIKPAAAIAKSPAIGLLATPGTIHRAYTQSLIEQFAPNINWIKIGSSELVELAEAKMYGKVISQASIEKIVAPFLHYKNTELDTLVLACTHFPLLKTELQQALPNIINWVDSTDGIAKRVNFLLAEQELKKSNHVEPDCAHDGEIIFTKTVDNEASISALRENYHLQKVTTLKL